MEIGFIGLGNMGSPICQHLVAAGHRVRAYDLNASALADAQAAGAEGCESIAQSVATADITFTSLPGPAEIEAVVLAAGGIAASARPGTMVVDLSTNAPECVSRLDTTLAKRSIDLLDAPVSGGVIGAKRGQLAVLVGGKIAPFQRVLPVLQTFARSVTHIGKSGSGATAKLVNNLIACNNVATAAEAFRLGSAAGIDPEVLDAVIRSSSGDSVMYRAVAKKFLRQDWSANFALDLAAKDMELVQSLAHQFDIALPLGAQTQQLLRMARAMGFGQDDLAAVLRLYEAQALSPQRAHALADKTPSEPTE